jgi:heat shock protein HslJ
MKGLWITLGFCAGLFFLSACTTPGVQQSGRGDLTGQVWELSSLNGKEILPNTSLSALFTADGKVGGSSGCNHYSGAYSASGNSFQITSPLVSTMMACPPEIMDQESSYLKALGEASTYSLTGDQLTFNDANKKTILVYKAQSQDLSGTSWEVISYNNGKQAVTTVLTGTTITLDFGTDGTVSGNSSCNNYHGTFTVTGKQITIGPLASTRMFCGEPEGVMDQETLYLAALQTAGTFKVEGTKLELRTTNGALAVQAAAAVPVTEASSDAIQGILWQWISVTNQSTGEVSTVPNPENYTLTFNADGTLNGKADCNNFSGTYTQENGFSITLGASTKAYCGEDSLDQQYLSLLSSVAAGGPDGSGGLALDTPGGEQRMLFQDGGPAQQ